MTRSQIIAPGWCKIFFRACSTEGDIVPSGLERLQEARKTGTLILAEGESDVWTLWFHRFGALGLPGAESLEDTKPRLQERLRQLLASCTASPTGVEFALAWPRLDQGGLTQLEEYIQEHPQVRAIIIDTWALLAPYAKSGGRSQYEGEYAALSPLKHLADTHHLAIVLVHHLRKAGAQDILDEITGSSGMVGTVDTILVLKRERGQNRATLYATGRDLPQERFLTLTFEQASGQWLLDETAGQQRTQE